ncbi:endosome/lysosome-associated apoptosis and autophagy regulator family member 2-like isoform X2 [Ptychodera flava]|uniref:endosome/lysosome-associated apoptosis and autophagy regulator family member 2-like isoform X2 n=1 Tax=Ptychodera flava TaxID=63121 RepID=UPI00396A91F7
MAEYCWQYLAAAVYVIVAHVAGVGNGASAQKLPTCQPTDFHFALTECDKKGVRWRVSVPEPDHCTGGAPPPPTRAPDCGFSCDAGEYLSVDDDQKCHRCPPGSYSMGGGVRYEDWTELPSEFSLLSEAIDDTWMHSAGNCNESRWHLMGNYIASAGDDCASTLVYTANLKKAGSVSFTYQYSDDNTIFHVYAQNDQCQTMRDTNVNRWPATTGEGEWKTITMYLKSGLNVIYWKTMGVDFDDDGNNKKKVKPVLIKEIEVMGIAYTSECTKCKPGTFARDEGSRFCEDCPADTFSVTGSGECQKCPDTHYSQPGSGNCTERKPCTDRDYFETHTPCNENKQTNMMYKWIEPKICRSDVQGAAQLPPSGAMQDCPPCNPGMSFYNNSHCEFCPENQYSNGDEECKPCPASTAPVYGMELKWWHSMPSNMDTSCLSMTDYGCASEEGWQLGSDNIHSGLGHSDEAYLILTLHTDGFRSSSGVFNGKPGEVGQVSFIFEMKCSGDCGFYFMEEDSRSSDVIESWEGSTDKQQYSYAVTKSGPRTFSWAFQKTDDNSFIRRESEQSNDMAVIYFINVTNTIDGGASVCKACPRGNNVKGCIPCPKGHYIADDNTCQQCPDGTYIHANNPYGKEACLACGPGTISHDNVVCYSDCQYKSSESQFIYDFSPLKGFHSVMSAPSFTAKGTRYFHLFNISLCGNNGEDLSLCKDNVTYYSEGQRDGLIQNLEDNVTSMLCRSTIIPSEDGAPLSAQPVSLGDRPLAVTQDTSVNNITVVGFAEDSLPLPDINFYYNSATSTTACPYGRASVISLRCDVTAIGSGVLELPAGCPDGTCDGCTFHFLWRTKYACPLCTEMDYKSIEENCKAGRQIIHYVWKEPKLCRDGVPIPENVVKKCPMLTFEAQIAITVATGCAALLIGLIIYFWKKTRKLEYKYQRLVQSSSGKDGELPTVDSCAVDEGDEDDIIFNDGKQKSGGFFSKFRSKDKSDFPDLQKKSLKELEEDDPLAVFE